MRRLYEQAVQYPIFILDLAPLRDDDNGPGPALRRSLAQYAARLGFSRYWVAEHHNMEGIASFDRAHAPAWARNPAAPVALDAVRP